MKVLHVIATGQRRGAEIFAAGLIAELGAAGVSQRLALLHGSGPIASESSAPVVLLSAGGRQLPGVRMDVRAVHSLRTLVSQWRPDIVQAHGGEPLKYALAASAVLGRHVVYRRIGSVFPWMASGVRRGMHARLIRRASLVVAVAEAIRRETVEAFRVPARRVVTIPNGIDPRRVDPSRSRQEVRAALGVSQDAPVVLAVGALTWEKNLLAYLDVAARVTTNHRECIHLIAGDGPMRAEVETAIRRRGLGGRVRVLGSRADIADLLHASDLLLLTSLTEGMPACVIEAGMAGLPVVAYSVGGVPEVVAHGETGLLAAPLDLDGLTGHVIDLLRSEPGRRAMGRAASERCRARFDIRVLAPSYLEAYERLLTSRRPGVGAVGVMRRGGARGGPDGQTR